MDSLKDLDITSEEVEKIQNSLKDEKFRKLFVEYAEEISNPENRKLYEEEITKMEAARGMETQFIHPSPGFVLKTSENGDKKAFINICKNDKIQKPSSTTTYRTNSQGIKTKGDQWSMPYSLSDGRDDLDKSGSVCKVYDVVFHPDTFKAAEKDPRLKQMMIDTSIDAIESRCNVKLDKPNVKEMKKLKFKGNPVATILRTKAKGGVEPVNAEDGVAALNLKYPYDDKPKASKPANDSHKNNESTAAKAWTSKPTVSVPEYDIIHRGEFDMKNFTNAPDSMTSTRPKELVIKIKLPLLDSAANVDLEVHERQLVVECVKPVSYKLDLTLPYPVNDDGGSAKFDKSKRCLVVTLPVLPSEMPVMPSFSPVKSEPLIQELPLNTEEGKPSCDDETCKVKEAGNVEYKFVVEDEVENYQKVENKSMTDDKEEKEEVSTACPSFSFTQDDDFVYFVIDACGVQPTAVTHQLPALQDAISIKITGAVTQDGISDFSLYLKFTNGCTISKDISVNVLTDNVALTLEKQPSCKGPWEMFLAGFDQNSLQEKVFLTEDSVKTIFEEDSQKCVYDEDAEKDVQFNVTKLNEDEMNVQINLISDDDGAKKLDGVDNEEADDASGDRKADDASGDRKADDSGAKVDETGDLKDFPEGSSKSENEVENVTEAWKNLNLDGCNGSSSPPSTPTSPSSLKSLLRGNRRRVHKSVSFCEEVEVEILVKKGKGKKGQMPKMRRSLSYEKIKDNSWNSFSDSEFVLNSENIKVNILKARETGHNKRRNRRAQKYNAARNSDSELGESSRERPKVKLSKKQMRRQRKLNNKIAKQVSESASERSETSEEECTGRDKEMKDRVRERSEDNERKGIDENVNEEMGISEDEVTIGVGEMDRNIKCKHMNNNNVESKHKDTMNDVEALDAKIDNNDIKPLELQDHKTTSAISFSNVLIHELD